jgi:hypothetical protein
MTTLPLQPESRDFFIESGLKEIFGSELLNENTSADGSLPVLFALRKSLTHKYGDEESGGMYIRAGRAGFYYWMRQFSSSLGWKSVDFRLLPPSARIKRSLSDLLQWMETEKFFKAQLIETPEVWQISINGLTGTQANLECNYFSGMVQELCCWAGGGKFYPTHESLCQAAGDACCVFEVARQPAV